MLGSILVLVLGMVKLPSKKFGGVDTPMGTRTVAMGEPTGCRGFEFDRLAKGCRVFYVLCHGDDDLGTFPSRREAIAAARAYSVEYARWL